MSELVWGIKNGDLDQVKDIVEQKVRWGVAHSQAHWWCEIRGWRASVLRMSVPFFKLL